MLRYGIERERYIRRWLWGVLGSSLLSMAVGGYWFSQVIEQLGIEASRSTAAIVRLNDLLATVESDVAWQTQEWKDMLLRAHDPVLFAKHQQQFMRAADRVKYQLHRAQEILQAANSPVSNVTQLQRLEQSLVEEYTVALRSLKLTNPLSYREVDQQVIGRDRALRAELERWRSSLQTQADDRFAELAKLSAVPRFYGSGLTAILLQLLSLLAFILTFRALRKIGAGDARVRAIYQSIGDAVLVVDMQGRIETVNETAQNLMGWTEAAARGKALSEVFQLYDTNNQMRVASPAEIVLRDGRPIPMSNGMVLHRPDGSTVAVEDSAAPVLDEHGQALGVVMVFHDVSKRYAMLRELRHERTLFQQTFDMAAVGMAHVGLDGRWLRVNHKLCEITGYSKEELLQLSFRGITHPDDIERDLDALSELLAARINCFQAEKRYIRKDGSCIWVALTLSMIWKEDGTPDYGIAIIEDIQARKDAEQAAAFAQSQYQSLFEQMPESVLLIGEDVQVIAYNHEALRQLEYSSEELLQLHVWDFEAVDDVAAIEARKKTISQTGHDRFESRYRTRSGRMIDVDVSVQQVQLPDGHQGFQTLFRDITEQKQATAQVEYLAYHDQLTGLANRRLLQDRLAQALSSAVRRNAQIALLYLDLDHFKDVNDALGHQAGDELLRKVAERLLECVRSEDTLARVGGDEFAIMLNDIGGPEDAGGVAHKILQEISMPFHTGDDELYITPSIGISVCPQDGRDGATLLKNADAALYQAKQSGRATHRFFTSELQEQALERLKIERLLRKAVEGQEFELHYQPQIDLRNGHVIGCEALIRWNHPSMGQVSPARFIPVAEHSSLIIEIGDWVIREVCKQARRWQDQGLQLKVSFNVSARQFMRPVELLQVLRDALEDTGAIPSLLEIEMTESLLLDPHGLGTVLDEIRAMGIHLALDDFGTGYSSLSYLRRFPIDILKIDRSFVSDSDKNEDDAEMVKTIIGMAHNLKMSLIAEGVETAGQALMLTEYGCEVAQGYHYSRPMPVAAFEALLQQRPLHGGRA